jgi:hypothetical protein
MDKRASVYSLPDNAKCIIAESVKGRHGTIFSPVHLLSFYLDPLIVLVEKRRKRPASNLSMATMPCFEATARLGRHGTEAAKRDVELQLADVPASTCWIKGLY